MNLCSGCSEKETCGIAEELYELKFNLEDYAGIDGYPVEIEIEAGTTKCTDFAMKKGPFTRQEVLDLPVEKRREVLAEQVSKLTKLELEELSDSC